MRLGELLIQEGVVTPEQLEDALEGQKDSKLPLGEILVSRKFVTRDQLFTILAKQRQVSYWSLENKPPDSSLSNLVDLSVCRSLHVLPLAFKDDRLLLGMRNPDDLAAIESIQAVTRSWVEPQLVDPNLLAQFLGLDATVGDVDPFSMDSYVEKAMDERGGKEDSSYAGVTTVTEADTRPVIGIVNHLIVEAIDRQASDIHLEPRSDRMEIRYRIDGQLVQSRDLPHALTPMVIARIKILAELDVAESRKPQDGRIKVQARGRSIDLRVSAMPNQYGQRIVMRVLDKAVALKKLDELGFSKRNKGHFTELIERPYGMVLVTGPTGSGKTTTLYAAVNALRKVSNNIITCEDPVEYELPGINQCQVYEKIGLTFATQLRAILRQDPDVILVGEIRDAETAETAIRAALTGHLVLSTLHSNDAPTSIPRLIDMGADAYMLSTSLVGIIAQRLIRLLCKHCGTSAEPNESEEIFLMLSGLSHVKELPRAVGCEHCFGTGYRGRIAVHEVLTVTEAIGGLIASQASLDEIRRAATTYGYASMQIDAMERVLAGITTLEEARRVIYFRPGSSSAGEKSGLLEAA